MRLRNCRAFWRNHNYITTSLGVLEIHSGRFQINNEKNGKRYSRARLGSGIVYRDTAERIRWY
jgi:hypothetical protein